MAVIQKEIYQNRPTISLPFGNGHARFLGIMMLAALYVQCFDDPFQPTLNLAKYPDNIPANVSAQQWSELLIHHKAAYQVYNTFKAVTQCLWSQFQEAIHENYLAELDNSDIGLTNVQPSIIYQNVINWCEKIDLKMVEENQKNL